MRRENYIRRNKFQNLNFKIFRLQGAFHGSGAKTVIPRRVVGKFSIRLVPNQHPDEISKLVIDYVERLHKERGSPNICKCEHFHGGRPFMSNPGDPNFVAAKKAMQRIWGVEPDFTREGGSIPVTLTLQVTKVFFILNIKKSLTREIVRQVQRKAI